MFKMNKQERGEKKISAAKLGSRLPAMVLSNMLFVFVNESGGEDDA